MEWYDELTAEQLFTAYVAAFSAILGGMISLAASFTVFWLSKRNERVRAAEELRARRDTNARIGLAKLAETTNQMFSLDQTLTEQFKDAHLAGAVSEEPALFVRSMVAGQLGIEKLTAEEMEFLFYSNSGNLVSDILLFEKRAQTTLAVLTQYNEQREKLNEVFLSNDVSLQGDSDAKLNVKLEGKAAHEADIRIASLNRLLADLAENAPLLMSDGFALIDRFCAVAEEHFGSKFPKAQKRDGAPLC